MFFKLKFVFSCFAIGSVFLSCASYFNRIECENTDWYQAGYNVALNGTWLDSNPKYKQCQGVEGKFDLALADRGFKEGKAKYCTLNHVEENAKSGKTFEYNFCDNLSLSNMKLAFQKGLRHYCSPENGYSIGVLGEVPKLSCPEDLRSQFSVEVKRGRKVFLQKKINLQHQRVATLESQIREKHFMREKRNRDLIVHSSRPAMIKKTVREYDPATGIETETQKVIDDPAWVQEKDRLESEITETEAEIRRLENQRSEAFNTIRESEEEMITL
jgi:hypothetical protein